MSLSRKKSLDRDSKADSAAGSASSTAAAARLIHGQPPAVGQHLLQFLQPDSTGMQSSVDGDQAVSKRQGSGEIDQSSGHRGHRQLMRLGYMPRRKPGSMDMCSVEIFVTALTRPHREDCLVVVRAAKEIET